MPWNHAERRDFLVEVRISARARDLAADGSYRNRQSMIEFISQAIALKHWRDRRDEHHRACEEARRRAQEETSAGSD